VALGGARRRRRGPRRPRHGAGGHHSRSGGVVSDPTVMFPLVRLLAAADDDLVEAAVARLRTTGRPVSLPGLCNAAWLGYRPDRSYDGPAAGALLDEIVPVAHGYPSGRGPLGPQPAVPVGAIVSLDLGSDIAYGEVVWKEGAHPELDAAWVPGWLAGAPALPPDGTAPPPDYAPQPGVRVLTERLVVDFGCFGDDLAPSAVKLARLRSRSLRVDRYGHLIVDAAYDDGADEADDVAFWAAWAAVHHPGALAAAGLRADASVLEAAAGNLADALATRPDVRSFGIHYLHVEAYDALVAADGAGGRLQRVVRGLAYLPARARTGWTAMSARVVDALGHDAVAGRAWPSMVVTASLLALDTLAEEAPAGDWNGVHVRLDDAWQGGGLWRTELLDGAAPVAADPAVALGLGWVEHTGGDVVRAEEPGPDDRLDAPDWYDGTDEDERDGDWALTGSEVAWLVHLTAHDIDTDRLRLPARVSQLVRATLVAAGQDRLIVSIQHDGQGEQRDFVGLGDDAHLNVEWPLGLLPGTTIRASWAVRSTVVVVATRRLPIPEQLAGLTYTHEYNLRVALAAAGAVDTAQPVTLRQLVRAAVRRHGDVAEDGTRCLALDVIVARCFGPRGEVAPGYPAAVMRRAVAAAADGLVAAGVARLVGDYLVIEDRTSAAGRRADEELLARYLEETQRRLRQHAARHWVAPSVVNLPPTWRRSQEKSEGWSEVAGTDGLPGDDLAPNQTWRKGHPRGRTMPGEVTAALERAKRSFAQLPDAPEAAADLDDVAADPFANDDNSPALGTAGTAGGREEPADA